MQTHASADMSGTIEQLNSFLRGELAAAETYRIALERLEHSPNRPTLEQCSQSHQKRAQLLTQAVLDRGGEPVRGSGAWGAIARILERGAAVLGEGAAIAVLVEGEDQARNDYLRDLADLDPSARQLIEYGVLPEQRRTHASIKAVRRAIS